MAKDLQLGLNTGYWAGGPPPNVVAMVKEAEQLGYDSMWTSEAYGSDCISPLAWWGSETEKLRLGTAIMQMSARQPAAAAMAAMTMDHLSGGRFVLGLGVSGPQVVEGWYGRPSNKPLARTREYVEIIRRAIAREAPVEFDGEFFQHPYHGEGSTGLGKALKPITHPLRREIPIFLGAEGPKNVTQTAEIADGWLPLYYSPYRQEVYADQLAGAKEGFEITAMATMVVTDDIEAGLAPVKAMLGFYIGGMGAKGQNYHTKLMQRMGYEAEALKVQELFFEGRRDEAIAAVPSAFADEISLVGPVERIRDRVAAWEDSPVTTILVHGGNKDVLRQAAEAVLG